jgi:hypothetical protein
VIEETEYELGGLRFGGLVSPYAVQVFDMGSPDVRTQDAPRPRRDGIYFGRDEKGARLLAWELTVLGADAAQTMANLAALTAVWSGDDVRSGPNATLPLRLRQPGAATRVVFGRPRRFSPVMGRIRVGATPVVMDFQAEDHLFYDDVERTLVLTQVPVESTGLTEPLSEPLSTQPFGSRPGVVNNVGDAPTPLVVRFDGPSTDPSLSLTGGDAIELRMSLATSDSVTVDTDAGTVLLNGAGNVSGKLTRVSRFFRLPPGSQELRYAALDPTATSKATVTYRPAYTSL